MSATEPRNVGIPPMARPLWRRHGDTLYALMVLLVLLAQTIGLMVLSLAATLHLAGAVSHVQLLRLAELSLA
ncbi:MAG: hypothetical protein ABR573_10925, partial [Candidatus Dormibacteria bacterium]